MEPTILEQVYNSHAFELLNELHDNLNYYIHSGFPSHLKNPSVELNFTFMPVRSREPIYMQRFETLLRFCLCKFNYILKHLIGKLRRENATNDWDNQTFTRESALLWHALFKYVNIGRQYYQPQKNTIRGKVILEWNEIDIISLYQFTIAGFARASSKGEYDLEPIPELNCRTIQNGVIWHTDLTLTTAFNYDLDSPSTPINKWKLILPHTRPKGVNRALLKEQEWIDSFTVEGLKYNRISEIIMERESIKKK